MVHWAEWCTIKTVELKLIPLGGILVNVPVGEEGGLVKLLDNIRFCSTHVLHLLSSISSKRIESYGTIGVEGVCAVLPLYDANDACRSRAIALKAVLSLLEIAIAAI